MAYGNDIANFNAGNRTAIGGDRFPSAYDQAGWAAGQKQADTAIAPAMQANAQKQDRFNAVFPWLQGQFGSLHGQFANAGGQSGQSPEISVGGVLNGQQIQQQVNSARATNDQTAAGQMRQQAATTAGQGFGASSPLLQALYGQTQASNLATNTGNERDIRLGAAQQNAQHVLGTQQARENQFASRQKEDIERRKPIWSTYGSLLSSIGGLV